MSVVELLAISAMIFMIILPGIRNNRGWISAKVLETVSSSDAIAQKLLKIPEFKRLKKHEFISIEDVEDVKEYLVWRDLRAAVSRRLDKLSPRIERRFVVAIIFSTLVLGLLLFLLVAGLFWVLSPSVATIGWLPSSHPNTLAGLGPILKFSYLISTLEMATSLANLLEKPTDNMILIETADKVGNWVSAILIYLAIRFPKAEIWTLDKHHDARHKRDILRGELIVDGALTNEEVEQVCKAIDAANAGKGDLVNLQAYRSRPGLVQNLDAGKNDFDWSYIRNSQTDSYNFAWVPADVDLTVEDHLYGREMVRQGKAILDSWFGNTAESVELGRAIWDGDQGGHLIMHPYALCVRNAGNLVIELRLYKKLPKSSEYLDLANHVIELGKQRMNNTPLIAVHFYYRYENKMLCYAQWTRDGHMSYSEDGKTRRVK